MTLATLARDRSAPRAALAVLVVLTEERLVTPQWQRLKLEQVRLATGRHHGQCSSVLAWLVAHGYLERMHDPFVGTMYRSTNRRG